ncbi:MAG: rhodanese-like domain-containing protein [Giesbergeria sp.]|nr:rhodanese-like domain-containing protein [Giesbergeria sp.]
MEQKNSLLVDVRSPGEFAAGHLAGAINLPLDQLTQAAAHALPDQNQPLVVYCLSGARSGIAVQWLQQNGYAQAVNGGGISALALQLGCAVQRL